ncbi:MAG TPA: ASPIC/UnbV domain-containing protein, partial [Planctomycetaceae bacterium]
GRFVELPAETAGPFFARERLGRGLARLDWNGDGRDEFAVSHLDDPAALLSNATPPVGRSLCVRLRATRTSRDAIGATVVVEVGEKRLVGHLTAGDGYQASNERKLVFGLGDAERADSVVVRWPSGDVSTFRDLAAGREWLMIEGRSRPLRLAEKSP